MGCRLVLNLRDAYYRPFSEGPTTIWGSSYFGGTSAAKAPDEPLVIHITRTEARSVQYIDDQEGRYADVEGGNGRSGQDEFVNTKENTPQVSVGYGGDNP
jgi:hypothetical protein